MSIFRNDDFEAVEYLNCEAEGLEFQIDSAKISDRGAFEVACHVVGSAFNKQRVNVLFWRNKETGKWSGFLKFFLTRFPGSYTESALGDKLLREDIDIFRFLQGKNFVADSVFGQPNPNTGKKYIQLTNFRYDEDGNASEWGKKTQKESISDDLIFTGDVPY